MATPRKSGNLIRPERVPVARETLRRAILAVLKKRPDVTLITETWPIYFVHMRHVTKKWVMNEDGFNPQHREAPLFYGQPYVMKPCPTNKRGWASIEIVPPEIEESGQTNGDYLQLLREVLGNDMNHEVAVRLGLVQATPPKERQRFVR